MQFEIDAADDFELKDSSGDTIAWDTKIPIDEVPGTAYLSALADAASGSEATITAKVIYGGSEIAEDVINLVASEVTPEPLVIILELDKLTESPTPPVILPDGHPLELTLDEWRTLMESREAWLDTLGEPTVEDDLSFSQVTGLVTYAESRLTVVTTWLADIEAHHANPSSVTKETYVSDLTDTIWAYDHYIHHFQIAMFGWAQYVDGLLFWTDSVVALGDRLHELPSHIDGIDIELSRAQWDTFQDAFSDTREALDNSLETIEITESAIQAGATLALGAATLGYGFTFLLATKFGSVALAAGGGLLAHTAGTAYQMRRSDGADHPEAFKGTISDLSGFTSVYMGLYEEDPISGERFELTPEQRGERIGAGGVQLVLSIVGVAGSVRHATEVRIPNPFKPSNWTTPPPGVLAGEGGATIAVATPVTSTLGIAVPNVQVITGTLGGTTPVVVYMTGNPSPQTPGDILRRLRDIPWGQYRRTGCEIVADKIHNAIGGTIHEITPRSSPYLGPRNGRETGWLRHRAVEKDGRVYDAWTGPDGVTISQYKAQWSFPDEINFGF